jgi:serine/threonine protein kinase/WD40 repeat protein
MSSPGSQSKSSSDPNPTDSLTFDGIAGESIRAPGGGETVGSGQQRQIGNYLICGEIGRGGMGVVYEATDLRLKRQVALKELPLGARLDKSRVKRFRNESLAAAQLNHPNIVPVYEAEESNGVHYFTMRLIDGRNLSEIVRSICRELSAPPAVVKSRDTSTHATLHELDGTRPEFVGSSKKGQPIRSDTLPHLSIDLSASGFSQRSGRHYCTVRTANAVARIGACVADALQHAHDVGVIHRDIKPSNLMLDHEGRVWVADFGLAHIVGAPSLTRHGVPLGTARYMSPEQAAGLHAMVDHRTDIYSLGVTLCELLILRPLFKGRQENEITRQIIYGAPPKIRQIDPAIPEDLAVILEKAMSRDPLERYISAREMADDLNRFLRNESITAKRPNLLKRGKHWVRRNKGIATAIGIGLAAVLMLSTSAAVFYNQQARTYLAALRESESYRVIVESQVALPTNPGLSVQLAKLAAELKPNVESIISLQRAMDANHEYASVRPREVVSGFVGMSPASDMAITCASVNNVGQQKSYPAIVHSLKDGSILKMFDNGEHVTSAAFSHSGRYAVTTSKPNSKSEALSCPPTIWDIHSGKFRRLEKAGLDLPNQGTFHPSQERGVFLANQDAVIYDVVNNVLLRTLRGHTDTIYYAEYSPDGKRILTIGNDSTIRIWDSETAKEIWPAIKWSVRDSQVARATFVASADALIVSEGYTVRRVPIIADADLAASDVALTSFKTVVSRSFEQFISLEATKLVVRSSRDLQQICELQIPMYSADEATPQLTGTRPAYHPIQQQAVIAVGGDAYLFDTSNGQLLGTLKGHHLPISDCCLSFDAIATVANDKTLRLWRTNSGRVQRTFTSQHINASAQDCPLTLSHDGHSLAVATQAYFQSSRRTTNGDPVPGFADGAVSKSQTDCDRLLTLDDRTAIVTAPSTSHVLYQGDFSRPLYFESQLVANGKRFLAHTMDAKAWLVDIESRSRLLLGSQAESVNGVYVSHDTCTIFLTFASGQFEAIDASSGKLLWSRRHQERVRSIDLSYDGKRLALVDQSGSFEIWEVGTWKKVVKTELPLADNVKFLADSEGVIVWNALRSTKVTCFRISSLDNPTSIAASGRISVNIHPSEPKVIIGSAGGAVLWHPYEQTERSVCDRNCRSVCLSNDRIGVLINSSITAPGELLILDSEGQTLKSETLELLPARIQVDFRQNQFILVLSAFSAEVFNLENGELEFAAPGSGSKIVWLGFTHDSTRLVTVSEQGVVSVVDRQGKLLASEDVAASKVSAVTAHAASDTLLIGFESGELVQCSMSNPKQLTQSSVHQRPIKSIQTSNDGNYALSAAHGESARYWNLRKLQSVPVGLPNPTFVEMDATGKFAVMIAPNSHAVAQAWLVDLGAKSQRLLDDDAVRAVHFSPDGSRVGVLQSSGRLEIQNRTNPNSRFPISHPLEPIKQFRFDQNSDQLFLAHGETCSVWSIPNGQPVLLMDCKLEADNSFANNNRSSPDGKWIVALDSRDAKIRKWSRDPVKLANELYQRNLSEQERKQFRLDLSLLAIPRGAK